MGVKQFSDAEKAFDTALNEMPGFNAALLGKARLAVLKNNLDLASQLADKAVAQNAKDIDAWMAKGEIMRLRKDHQGSKSAYQQALQLDPNNSMVLLSSATALILLKEHDSATQNIQKVITFDL